jgi:hypothetical protein
MMRKTKCSAPQPYVSVSIPVIANLREVKNSSSNLCTVLRSPRKKEKRKKKEEKIFRTL